VPTWQSPHSYYAIADAPSVRLARCWTDPVQNHRLPTGGCGEVLLPDGAEFYCRVSLPDGTGALFQETPGTLSPLKLLEHEGFLICRGVILSSVGFIVSMMGRFNRVVALDIPHHITQRGNARRFILDCDVDRAVYLKLLRENVAHYGVGLLGYCLMSNHVHLIVSPSKMEGLAEALKQTHGRYACYWNIAHQSSGHVWQGRFYSCPLDQTHLWEALRYTELNPVRARLVSEARLWPWSSAASHCIADKRDDFLALESWDRRWTFATWREYLADGELESNLAILRQRTHTGRPLGSAEFVQELEKTTNRPLALQKRGPREKILTDRRQGELSFDS
jgi:putative transposase